MALFEYLSMAFASIKSNKMRSLLTMLGIIIGIAAVIGILAIWQHDRILHIAAKLGFSKKKGTEQGK